MDFPKLISQEIAKMNERTIKETEEEFQNFKDALKRNECYLCHQKFDYFFVENKANKR